MRFHALKGNRVGYPTVAGVTFLFAGFRGLKLYAESEIITIYSPCRVGWMNSTGVSVDQTKFAI